MQSSGMWLHVGLVRTNASQELVASIKLCFSYWLLIALLLASSFHPEDGGGRSVLNVDSYWVTRRHITEDGILGRDTFLTA
jgi:hypothetical protein